MTYDRNIRRDALKAAVLKSFLLCNAHNRTDQIRAIVDELDRLEMNPQTVYEALLLHSQNSQYPPTLADILGYEQALRSRAVKTEIEKRWDFFVANAFSPYKKLPDWAYTAKKILGEHRVENSGPNEFPWIRKEFFEIVEAQLSDGMELISDGRNWKKINGNWALFPERKNNDAMLVGDILKK